MISSLASVRRIALEHLDDIARLDDELVAVKQRIADAVTASATTLTELHGVGPVIAAVILGQVRDIRRFPNPRPVRQLQRHRTDRSLECSDQAAPVGTCAATVP